ncbi:hypothetical protein TNCV_1360021 [Trichonephila clavipes]|nr:hypothetical protein TNCV_1360021 [Trichonephila clavipes]
MCSTSSLRSRTYGENSLKLGLYTINKIEVTHENNDRTPVQSGQPTGDHPPLSCPFQRSKRSDVLPGHQCQSYGLASARTEHR